MIAAACPAADGVPAAAERRHDEPSVDLERDKAIPEVLAGRPGELGEAIDVAAEVLDYYERGAV